MTKEELAMEIPDDVLEYLREKKALTLATAAPGGPPHAATLVYVSDGAKLYVWVHASSTTARHLDENPLVGFTVDEYREDWRSTRGVQASGRCTPIGGEELAQVGEMFGRKFPDLRPGASGAVSFYRIDPDSLFFIDNSSGAGDPLPDEYRRRSVL